VVSDLGPPDPDLAVVIHDAIVVGAGLSGLACARALTKAGAKVVVLEARDRVGGRLLNATVAGGVVDLGGQWMSVGQPRLLALAAELGVASFPQRRAGRAWLDSATEPGLFARIGIAFAQLRAARRITRASAAIRRGQIDADLDAASLADWLVEVIPNATARERIAMHAELVFAADPADLSLLHYLSTFGVTGGFGPKGPDLPGGGREHRFAGGAQQLALRIAAELGDAVRLNAPVRAIESGEPMVVRTEGEHHQARHVVLALPPALAREIAVELSPAARLLADSSQMGPVVKVFAAYDRPFWRDDGSSGEAYFPRGTVRATIALADEQDQHHTLLAFVVGPAAAAWSTRQLGDRRTEVLALLEAAFGAPAARPLDFRAVDWGRDAWSRGCVAGLRPGVLSQGARWKDPVGRLHLAGTESAEAWPGYMEGALEAGARAANEIVAAG
jgi:monoamine oxidase